MRSLGLASIFLLCLMGTAFAQGHFGQSSSLGGFGNVLYPGTGHAPPSRPGGITGPYFYNTFGGRRFGGNNYGNGQGAVIIPYPVFYSGYGYSYGPGYGYDPSLGYAQGYGDQPPVINSGSTPPVIINQNFVPPQANPVVREYAPTDNSGDQQQQSSLKMYQAPTPGQAPPQQLQAPSNPDQATIYLIALTDHTIVQALGYWMEGSTLHYVTVDHDLNQLSLGLIDRDLSQRLNSERGIEFKLPAAR